MTLRHHSIGKLDQTHTVKVIRALNFQLNNRDHGTMAEWLRRLTGNQMGSTCVGSSPTRSDNLR